jgi:citrate synthase
VGHAVYEGGDPRADVLLQAARRARLPQDLSRAESGLREVMAGHDGPHPNVDFALAVVTEAADMVDDAGEAIFGIARCAGWIAHAIEEYQHRLRYRPRAAYTGPPPG